MSSTNGLPTRKSRNYAKGTLDAVQTLVAEEIAFKHLTGKTEEQIADEHNVSRVSIWRWKSLQAFNDHINTVVKEYQRSNLVDVNATLIDILINGNEKSKLKAIELYYRTQGMFKDNLEVTALNGGNKSDITVDDIMAELDDITLLD
jgi:hypothetical protein